MWTFSRVSSKLCTISSMRILCVTLAFVPWLPLRFVNEYWWIIWWNLEDSWIAMTRKVAFHSVGCDHYGVLHQWLSPEFNGRSAFRHIWLGKVTSLSTVALFECWFCRFFSMTNDFLQGLNCLHAHNLLHRYSFFISIILFNFILFYLFFLFLFFYFIISIVMFVAHE
jgi:hypothetical protein